MRRVLLCTIARDCAAHLETWYDLLSKLSLDLLEQGWIAEVSVAENDSKDNTAQWLRNRKENWEGAPCPILKAEAFHLSTQTLGTQRYGSIWSLDRLRNLANARQKCLDQVGDLTRFDKIAYVEVDCTYSPDWCAELILARHPLAAGLGEPDIYSGWSLRSLSNPKESVYLYDVCATRATCYDTSWDITEANGTWRAKTVIPTDLGGADAMCLHAVWSAFNCFAVYNAEPFKRGLKWDWANYRLDTGQGSVVGVGGHIGALDADTSCICESFRAHGFNKVFLNTNCLTRHQ
jgi:glycosyltransferase involved in cell wall biosynthesis